MAELIERFQLPESYSESSLNGVRFIKSLQHISRTPILYEPGICIVAQGKKTGYLEDQVFQYDKNNYLAVAVV